MTKRNARRGFTLIELLVVVLIIGILAAVAVPQYQKVVEKVYSSEAIAQLRALAQAQHIYKLANGEYTKEWNELDIDLDGVRSPSTVNSEKYQSNWYFSLTNVQDEYPTIWARRVGKDFQKGAWYIVYDLLTDKLYCETYENDEESTRICKTFGTVGDCPWPMVDRYGKLRCTLIP